MQVLIATDLLARGIHIEQLPVVINFELPMHAETYVHRVGRTARAGEQGVAMSLVCHGEMDALSAIRHLTQRALPVQDLVGFPVTDKPSTGESKRAPRDKKPTAELMLRRALSSSKVSRNVQPRVRSKPKTRSDGIVGSERGLKFYFGVLTRRWANQAHFPIFNFASF